MNKISMFQALFITEFNDDSINYEQIYKSYNKHFKK